MLRVRLLMLLMQLLRLRVLLMMLQLLHLLLILLLPWLLTPLLLRMLLLMLLLLMPSARTGSPWLVRWDGEFSAWELRLDKQRYGPRGHTSVH